MKRLLAVAVVPIFLLAACGDDDDDANPVTPAVTADGSTVEVANVVTVHATDYKFTGVPAAVPEGTQFVLQNDSTAEAHEMIVIRIPDGEDRTVGQLAALPEEESNAVFGDTEPAFVLVALPGQSGQAVEGDGTVTEPGRYAVVCFIPKGADPAKLAEAMSDPDATGPPDLGTGPPHIMEGMYAEVTVGG